MISSSVYIQNISLLGNKEQNRFSEGFFFGLSYVLIPVDVLKRRSVKTCGWPKQSHGFFLSFFELFLHICAKETVGKTLWLVQTVSRSFPQFSLCFDIDVLMRRSVKRCGWPRRPTRTSVYSTAPLSPVGTSPATSVVPPTSAIEDYFQKKLLSTLSHS